MLTILTLTHPGVGRTPWLSRVRFALGHAKVCYADTAHYAPAI